MLPLPSAEHAAAPASGESPYPSRVPLLSAALAQCGALLVIGLVLTQVPEAAIGPGGGMPWAALQGGLAALLGRVLGMDRWWMSIHLLFAPGLLWAIGLGLPSQYPLIAFCLLASVYWGVSRTRVPLFLSSRAAAREILNLLPRERNFTFVDLGSGLGGVLSGLARARPRGDFHGIEAAPMPFLFSRLRTALSMPNCRVSWGDFRDFDLGGCGIVYVYLSPAAMGALWIKAKREMRAGSLLISNSFDVPGVSPSMTVSTGDQGGSRLLLWHM